MTNWTDDELGTLLAETFWERETLADPNVARRLAERPAPRRYWPAVVAVAAAVAVLVTGTVLVVGRSNLQTTDPSAPSPALPTPTEATDAAYAAVAAAEADRMIALAQVPSGALRLPGAPDGWPELRGAPLYLHNKDFQRTAWFSVPMDPDEVQTYLIDHAPQGLRRTRDGGIGEKAGTRYFVYTSISPPRPEVIVGPRMAVHWREIDGSTVIRFDTLLRLRHARTARTYLTGSVTRVDFDRPKLAGGRAPTITFTDPADIDRLVRAVNGLYASETEVAQQSISCGPPRTGSNELTFRTNDETFVFRTTSFGCDTVLEVVRNGTVLTPTLDMGHLYRDIGDRIVR